MKITTLPILPDDLVVILGSQLTFARFERGRLAHHVRPAPATPLTSSLFRRCLVSALRGHLPARVLLFAPPGGTDERAPLLADLLTAYCLGKEIPFLVLPTLNELLRASIKPTSAPCKPSAPVVRHGAKEQHPIPFWRRLVGRGDTQLNRGIAHTA